MLHLAYERGPLELLQVVVDLLARHVEPAGDRRGRRGRAQRFEDVDPERVQQHLERIEIGDHVHAHASSPGPQTTEVVATE